MLHARRELLSGLAAAGAFGLCGLPRAFAQASRSRDLSSAEVNALFERFGRERRMIPELGAWLDDREIQRIRPWKAFDNIWYVGVRWVASYVIRTEEGVILIDTTHEPFVDLLLENLKTVGARPDEIRYVLMTHGHFDHVGGAGRLRKLLPRARFGMSRRGWDEAMREAKGRHRFEMPPVDLVLKDGDRVKLGSTEVTVLETPGHTWGTCSYVYPVTDRGERHTAVTVGGQGLNAIGDHRQVEAYVASMRRLADPALGIDVDLTAHPFTTGLTERIPDIRAHVAGVDSGVHPLINRKEYLKRLEHLVANARESGF